MRYYGSVIGGLETAIVEMWGYPGAKICIDCTCGLSQDFDEVDDARVFLESHATHIVEWSIGLVGTDGAVVWELKALSV